MLVFLYIFIAPMIKLIIRMQEMNNGGIYMDRFLKIKNDIENWIEQNSKYEVLERREVDQSEEGSRLFSILFTDREKSIRYKTSGFVNRNKECSITMEVALYAGIDEKIEERKKIDGYDIFISNNEKSKEAFIKLVKQLKDDEPYDMQNAVNTIVEYGINRFLY